MDMEPVRLVDQLREGRIAAYRAAPGDIREHYGIEETVLAGGYGYRQVMELVQNGADAVLEEQEASPDRSIEDAQIAVILKERFLYVANTGAPVSDEGARALLQSHSSPKRGNQIGRFGIGFKSLLRLNGGIDLISRGLSMQFDPKRTQNLIREEFQLPESERVPSLRLAWDLDGDAIRANDPTMSKLGWATTIVRAEIGNTMMLDHLREEMLRFPAPFLLFLPVPVKLTMEFGDEPPRCIERLPGGADSVLRDGDKESRWRVVERETHITDPAAIADATDLHARNNYKSPIAWAIPVEGKREEAGRFWAFFPTETPTRIPGILNAPWKLNSDRGAVIGGEWNEALMREAAGLIAESLPELATEEDPGKPLDAFPRRLERKEELASTLVEALWERLVDLRVIPDSRGSQRQGSELRRHPLDNKEIAELWAKLGSEDGLQKWVHPSCLAGDRRGRLEELAQRIQNRENTREEDELPQLEVSDASSWFDAVATTNTEGALNVLSLSERYAGEVNQFRWQTDRNSLKIVPTAGGKLCCASAAVIAPAGASIPGKELVSQAIVDDPDGNRVLTEILGIGKLDDKKWNGILNAALSACTKHGRGDEAGCIRLWELLRNAPESVAKAFVDTNAKSVRVKRIDGKWKKYDETLRPGRIVSDEDAGNRSILVDQKFHEGDDELLDLIGICEFPKGQIGPDVYNVVAGENQNLLSEWLSDKRREFDRALPQGQNPNWGYLNPKAITLPCGWALLGQLSGSGNARATRELLMEIRSSEVYLRPVEFGHDTNRLYGTAEVSAPIAWFLSEKGTIAAGQQTVAVKVVISRLEQPILKRVAGLEELMPALRLLLAHISAKPSVYDYSEFWQAIFTSLVTAENETAPWLGDLWDGGAKDGWIPSELPAAHGMVPLSEVYVSVSHDLGRHGRNAGLFVVGVSPATAEEWCKAGARDLADMFSVEWDGVWASEKLLVEAVPELAVVLSEDARKVAAGRSVTGLRVRFEGHTGSVACVMWEGVLCQDIEQLDLLPRITRLEAILQEVENAGWLSMPAQEALRLIGDSQLEERRRFVAGGADLADRLLRAVNGRERPLREVLGHVASGVLPADTGPRQIAELALAIHGPLVLQRLAGDLEEEGLRPPGRWGTSEARRFVDELGFPEEFAAAAESKRDSELMVGGPIRLPKLHDFQEEVVEGLRALIQKGSGRRRAVVSLPTGGGKTRATVEAAVSLVLAPAVGRRSVLWIAQTDELCEQAVQAFRQVWVNLGAQSTDLRVIRLWGGHKNPARSDANQPVVVIASIQTLNSRVGQDGLEWMCEPGLVVVDECHHAITKSYTGVLRWLDAEAPRPGTTPGDEPPVIGLSATPFRGSRDDDESLRLAKRFDQTWLPRNQENLYERLLEGGILARAVHEPLTTKATIPADLLQGLEAKDDDLDSLQIENALEVINRILAQNEDRNRQLIDTIVWSEEKSILCFANSVDHAEELAARLCIRGIPAAAISGQTPRSARRYFLSAFHEGKVRVLCNHSVLSTGFDAPKTDMLLISRQVLSPVRYMQMVGRGLRGEKNGGTPECRIITVMDNLGRFRDRHPYHYCAKFFSEVGSSNGEITPSGLGAGATRSNS